MGWIKALAIGVAVIVVLSMVSVIVHLAYLIILAVAIGAIVAVVLKARARLRAGREERARKIERKQAGTAITQRQFDVPATPVRQQPDVEAELARLRKEME